MALTVRDNRRGNSSDVTVATGLVVNRVTVEQAISGRFPGWVLTCIYEARRRESQVWTRLSAPDNDPDKLTDLVRQGYEQFQLRLDHPQGGITFPDYWAWELGESVVGSDRSNG